MRAASALFCSKQSSRQPAAATLLCTRRAFEMPRMADGRLKASLVKGRWRVSAGGIACRQCESRKKHDHKRQRMVLNTAGMFAELFS